ncbi:Multicopper oxidase, types 2 and 3 [Synechocystis sp. LKSZ1]
MGGALGIGGSWLAWQGVQSHASRSEVAIPPLPQPISPEATNPLIFLRHFDYGTVKEENGQRIREFRAEARTSTLQLNTAVSQVTWNLNGQVPGPTLRAKEGDRIRVIFYNRAGHSHSLHFHGIHEAEMDGIKPVRNNSVFIYEFNAQPYGVHLYHCHIAPVTRHISKGLYGMFIVDPPDPRPPADEMVLIMGGYDTNEDHKNELYAFNGLPSYYMSHPIPIQQEQLVRLYLLNMIEYDLAATFHLHANFFEVYPTGMTLNPSYKTDVITMGTAERHILEFAYRHPGRYMFHPHQDAIAEAGCMGQFEVIEKS